MFRPASEQRGTPRQNSSLEDGGGDPMIPTPTAGRLAAAAAATAACRWPPPPPHGRCSCRLIAATRRAGERRSRSASIGQALVLPAKQSARARGGGHIDATHAPTWVVMHTDIMQQ